MQSLLVRLRKSKQRMIHFCARTRVLCSNFCRRRIKRRKVVFVTFADGNKFTSWRLASETSELDFFDSIIEYSANTLGPDFRSQFAEHLKIDRGYGLWAWKPYVILQTLSSLNLGDVLFYADSGCTVATQALYSLQELLNTLMSSPDRIMLADDGSDYRIRSWTKAELIKHFGFATRNDLLNKKMWEAGRIALQNTSQNRLLVQQWCDAASQLRLIDNSPSSCDEHDGFLEHRHDQSILNLLLAEKAPLAGLERVFYATRLKS
jgi:hypothetical protein